jgi:D-xylose transport system substrate-binding protein
MILNPLKIVFPVMLLLLLFGGCADNRGQEEEDTIRIAFITETFVIERWQRDRDIFVARAKELGAEVLVKHTFEDSEDQIRVIEEIIRQDVDVIVIIPHDKDALTAVVKKAIDHGIGIIAYDRLIMNADIDLYISFDNFAVGRLMAEYLMKEVPVGNYVIINGSPYDHNSLMLREGYMSVLDPHVASGDIELLGETWAEGWRGEKAYEFVNSLIAEGKEINAIVAANDLLAEGAIKALSENMLAGIIPVSGQDTELAASQRIVEGTQHMSVYKPIGILAKEAAEAAVMIARGENPPSNDKIDNGTYVIPYMKFRPVAVTKDNMMDTIIRDGFHLFEDVYRNIQPDRR